MQTTLPHFIAFKDQQILAQGELIDIVQAIIQTQSDTQDHPQQVMPFIFDHVTGQQVDLDWTGTIVDVIQRYSTPTTEAKVGRPKLGVKAKEITLLQKQWDWLASQSGNISATLRKLIDKEMNDPFSESNIQLRKQSIDRLLSVMLGESGIYEEATRALYRDDAEGFCTLIQQVEANDIRLHILNLAAYAFPSAQKNLSA